MRHEIAPEVETDDRKRVVRVDPGEAFPSVTARKIGGGRVTVPEDVRDGWSVILLYRGHWCPYCRRQLADFQRKLDQFSEADVRIVALSADPEAEARATVEEHGLEFPVGYAVDPPGIRDALGAYLGEDETFVQATGFVLRPGGLVELAVYSSGAVGRLVAADVAGLIEYARGRD